MCVCVCLCVCMCVYVCDVFVSLFHMLIHNYVMFLCFLNVELTTQSPQRIRVA